MSSLRVSTVQRWNTEIANCDAVKDMTCVNRVKHREPKTFDEETLFERHTIACYGFSARTVVNVDVAETEEASGSHPSIFHPTGRGRK